MLHDSEIKKNEAESKKLIAEEQSLKIDASTKTLTVSLSFLVILATAMHLAFIRYQAMELDENRDKRALEREMLAKKHASELLVIEKLKLCVQDKTLPWCK